MPHIKKHISIHWPTESLSPTLEMFGPARMTTH